MTFLGSVFFEKGSFCAAGHASMVRRFPFVHGDTEWSFPRSSNFVQLVVLLVRRVLDLRYTRRNRSRRGLCEL